MKQEGLKERMELLEIGEKLGYPRLGYGRPTKIPHDKRIPPGQVEWEKFAAHAHVRRIYPALRIGRVLRDNNVEVFHPISSRERTSHITEPPTPVARMNDVQFADLMHAAAPNARDLLDEIVTPQPAPRRKRGGHKRPPHPNSKRNRTAAS